MQTDSEIHVTRVTISPSGKVNRKDAAAALGREPKTLAEWSLMGRGPRPIKIGGRIFYDWAEVSAIARGEKPVTAWADAA